MRSTQLFLTNLRIAKSPEGFSYYIYLTTFCFEQKPKKTKKKRVGKKHENASGKDKVL